MNINLSNGDCIEYMKTIPDKSINLVLTDPPYGTTACSWDIIIPFDGMWEQLNRILAPGGAICLFGSEPFSSLLRVSNLNAFKYDWIWSKNKGTGHLNAKRMPMKYHEIISVFSNSSINYYPQVTSGHKPMNYAKNKQNNINSIHGSVVNNVGSTVRNPRSIVEFSTVNNDGSTDGGRFHPSQKPVSLLEYFIKTYTKENDTVLDFTMGSGSTGIACVNLDRNFIGIELDTEYFNIANERINQAIEIKNSNNNDVDSESTDFFEW